MRSIMAIVGRPEQAPVDENVDLEFLATRFKLSGGGIRNCSLAAAFIAAEAKRNDAV